MNWKNLFSRPHPVIVAVILIGSLAWLWFALPRADMLVDQATGGVLLDGEIVQIVDEREVAPTAGARTTTEQDLVVRIEGDRDVRVVNDLHPLDVGDGIFVNALSYGTDAESFSIIDARRTGGLWVLLIVFILLVLAVSGRKGAFSLVGLVFSVAVIVGYTLPALLAYQGGLVVGLITAALILTGTLYISYGFNAKSLAALAGIVLTLALVGFIAVWAVDALHFTGFGDESVIYLNAQTENQIDLIGLIVAGIIIAAVGVLDDVAVTQASTVFALGARGGRRGMELFREAMRVGHDHISAVINTLVLAYIGAALPLILLLHLTAFPLDFMIGGEAIAEEIARTLISSMGLVLAVPATTAIAVFLVARRNENDHA